MSKQHIASSAGPSRKYSKSSLKSSASRHLNLDPQQPARIKHSGCLNSAADKRGNWCDISPFVEDISLNNKHKLNGYVKNNLDDSILGRIALLNFDKKLRSAVDIGLHEHQMGKIKQDEFLITEEIYTDKDNEIQKIKMIQHLQDELFDCRSTIQLLKSEYAETTKELQSKIVSTKEELAKEIGKRSNLENSQTALMKLMEEMEKLLQSERDKVCDLMSNCTNLKQDSNHWQTVFKQEQQFRQELEQKYFEFLDKSRIQEQNDNCLLLTETEKLRLQYSDLIEQLNRMKTVADEQQEREKKLAKENEQLRCTVDSLNGILSKHVEKPSCDLECNSSDSGELREKLKSAVQDSHLYQQRCNQLNYKIDELKKELQEKISELTRLESSSNQNICELSNNLKDKELEFEKCIREKEITIEKSERSVQELSKEKSSFLAQLHATSLELEGKQSACRLLQQENQILSSNIDDLKIQQKCQDYLEKSLNDMTEQRTKLSYENGLLNCRLEKLQLELERMPTILSELQQSKKNALEIDARNIKLQTELVASQTLVHQVESELKSMKTLLEQLYSDLNAADAAKDKITAEKQRLTDEVTRLRNGQMKTVEDLQSALAASREDTSNVSAMLERAVKSQTDLQATVESVEAEKAKQDSLIEELMKKNEELRSARESLESDLTAAESRLQSCRDLESAELAPLKRELSKLRDDNKRLLTSTDKLLNSNEKHKSEIEQLQNEVSKKSELLKTLKEEREIRDGLYSKQKENLEEKVEFLNSQLIQEQNDATKKFEAEKQEMNFLFDQLRKKNNEISDENTQLQFKNKELQFRLMEENQKTESLLKTSRDRIAEMEKNNDVCMKKNEAQSQTIRKFMSVVLELQSEMKSLEQVKQSRVDGQQSNELCKVQNAQGLKLSYEDETERAVWKEMKRLVQDLKESRDPDFKPRYKSKHGMNRALKSVERATALVEASCKTVGCTTDEHSFSSNIDLEKKMLQRQLENERNKTASLENKLRQVQESSFRHTEALARELDFVKSTKLFLGDK